MDIKFYKVIFLIVIGYVIFVIFNYDMNWVHNETPSQIRVALKDGASFRWADFLPTTDNIFDDFERIRFVSYTLYRINIKFRIWVFNYIPPHPTFVLTWIFTLILGPILFFKFVYNYTSQRISAWVAVILYMMSQGFLSGITVFHHPAKPMTTFFAILCLYISSKINLLAGKGERFFNKGVFLYAALLVVFFVSFLTDESAFIVYISLPFLFFDIFKRYNNKKLLYAAYLAPLLLFIILAAILEAWTRFYFFDYIINGAFCGSWKYCSFDNFYRNFQGLIDAHLVPFYLKGINATIVFSLIYAIYMYFRFSQDTKQNFLRALAASLACLLVYSFGAQFHGGEPPMGTVYGSVFSVFFVLPVAIALSFRHKFFDIINRLILMCLVVACSQNYIHLTYPLIHGNIEDLQRIMKEIGGSEELQGSEQGRLTFPMVLKVWKNRDDEDFISRMQKEYPRKSFWLFNELKYLRKKGH